MTIHVTLKQSATMPKRGEKKLKRGSRDGETGEQFASSAKKWGVAGADFGTGRTTRQDREKGIQHSRLEGNEI
jgi:hypothetical protein